MNKRLVTIFIFLFFYSSIYSQISDSLFLNSARSPKKFRLAPIQIEGAEKLLQDVGYDIGIRMWELFLLRERTQ